MVTSSDIATEVPTFEPPPLREGSVDAGLALVLKDRFFDDVPTRPQPVPLGPPTNERGLHHPAAGLAAALALGLLAAFFGWVSAAPFWLAAGVGSEGTAVVVQCRAQALGDHCTGRFAGDRTVRLAGLDPSDRRPGTAIPVRVLRDSDVAYADPVAGLHLRWMLGFLVVPACGVGVGAATGVRRLRREGHRKMTTLWAISFAGPAMLALIPVLAALF